MQFELLKQRYQLLSCGESNYFTYGKSYQFYDQISTERRACPVYAHNGALVSSSI